MPVIGENARAARAGVITGGCTHDASRGGPVVSGVAARRTAPVLRQRGFQALFAGAVFDMVGHSIAGLFTPLYLGELGARPATVGLVIGLSAFAFPLVILAAGSLLERVPPRRLILGTRALVALGMLLASVAQEWWHMAPALVLVAGGSLGYPAVSRVVADLAAPEERAGAFALIYGVGSNVSMIVAPAIGGIVAGALGLRWVYALAFLLELLSVASFTAMSNPPAASAAHTRQTYRAVIAYRPVFVMTIFLFLAMVILSTGYTLLPTFLYEFRSLSVGAIGWLGSLTGVGGMLLALGFTRSRRRTRVASPILITLAIVPFSLLLLLASGSLWAIALASLLAGSWGLVWALADAAVGNIAPERLRALSFGFSEVLGGAGVAVGPMLAGLLYDIGPRVPLLVALGGTLLVLLPGALYLRGSLEQAQAALERDERETLLIAQP